MSPFLGCGFLCLVGALLQSLCTARQISDAGPSDADESVLLQLAVKGSLNSSGQAHKLGTHAALKASLARIQACHTVGSAGDGGGHPCVFPFKYDGKTYKTCVYQADSLLTSFEGYWCATTVDANGNYQNWGECSATCFVEVVPVKCAIAAAIGSKTVATAAELAFPGLSEILGLLNDDGDVTPESLINIWQSSFGDSGATSTIFEVLKSAASGDLDLEDGIVLVGAMARGFKTFCSSVAELVPDAESWLTKTATVVSNTSIAVGKDIVEVSQDIANATVKAAEGVVGIVSDANIFDQVVDKTQEVVSDVIGWVKGLFR